MTRPNPESAIDRAIREMQRVIPATVRKARRNEMVRFVDAYDARRVYLLPKALLSDHYDAEDAAKVCGLPRETVIATLRKTIRWRRSQKGYLFDGPALLAAQRAYVAERLAAFAERRVDRLEVAA